MKKFISVLCALMVMLSVNAAPVALQAGKLSKNHFEKMQISKENVAQKAVGGKFIPGQAIKRAPAAKMETYDVTIVDCVGTYWDTDIQYIMNDADGQYRFAFDIILPTGQEDVTLGQTYTLADMYTEYTWGGCPATGVSFADFTAATFVKTVDPVTGLVNVTASATDADGNVYNIVYQEQPLPDAQDTVTLAFDTAHTELTDRTRAQGMFQFVGKDANAAVYLAINSDSLVGHYTMDDINTRYTRIMRYNNGDTTNITPLDCQASVTFATAENMYIVTAAILGSDTTLYMAYMAYYQKPFEPTGDTIDVNITEPMNYQYYKSDGDWYMSGANAEYKVYLDVVNNDSTSPAGNYTLDQALYQYTNVTVLATGTKLELVSLEATVTDVEGRIDVAADMLCLDGNVYHVTMFYAIPEALAFDTIVADNLELTPLTIWGMVLGYTASASDEDYLFSLSLDKQTEGVYDAAGGSVTNLSTGVASKIYSGNITLAYAVNGTPIITGSVLCYNNVVYTLNLRYVKFSINILESANGIVVIPDYTADDTIVTISATPSDGYHFTQWSDGNTDNPRTIELTQDTTFTAEFAKNSYTISTTSANPEWGTTAGDTAALYLDEVEISAIPNYGYHFVRWNDNNGSNPRTVSVTEDKTYTATFAKNVYSITKNAEHGTISGNSSAEYLDFVTLTVTPDYGYHFTQWSDGVKDNPRIAQITQDTTFTAEFARDYMRVQIGDLYYNLDATNQTAEVAENRSASGDIIIPSSVTCDAVTYTVTSIGGWAFQGCTGLTSVTIGNSVTSIGDYAFNFCTGLTSVTIPNSVTSIGDEAFKNCSGLTSVTIGNGVTSIGDYTFMECSGLTSVTIPNSVTSIGYYAFRNCSGLTSPVYNAHVFAYLPTSYSGAYTIPDGIESIAGGAFRGCSSLTSVTIPNSVTSIGDYAFYGCTGLTSAEAPAGFFDVPEDDWPHCTKILSQVTVNGGELTENALLFINRSYKTLHTLDVSGVTNTEFADEAFKGYYNLQQLVLPAGLQKVSYMMVADCKNLQSIDIPASVEEIEQSAFEDCRSIQSITFGGAPASAPGRFNAPATASQLRKIGNWAFYNAHELQHLDIPEGVTEIGDGAFYGCTYLEDMTLSASIQAIGDNCFALCAKLTKIICNAVTPPTIQAKTFFEVKRQIPVYVPDEAVSAYENDTYWQEFDIQGISNMPMGINDTTFPSGESCDKTSKILHNGRILILRGDKTYTLTGQETIVP